MRLFGRHKLKRVVVKEYGRDSFLGLINPILTLAVMGARRADYRSSYQARLLRTAEDDAAAMVRLGYRVVESREFERPALGITYLKVTYELVDPAG